MHILQIAQIFTHILTVTVLGGAPRVVYKRQTAFCAVTDVGTLFRNTCVSDADEIIPHTIMVFIECVAWYSF